MYLDNDLRLKALDLFERGFSYKAVARQLQLNPETVREWVYLWRALGSDLYKHPRKATASLLTRSEIGCNKRPFKWRSDDRHNASLSNRK